jgi:hypothetical protein
LELDACYGAKRGQQANRTAERPRWPVKEFRGRSEVGSAPVQRRLPKPQRRINM